MKNPDFKDGCEFTSIYVNFTWPSTGNLKKNLENFGAKTWLCQLLALRKFSTKPAVFYPGCESAQPDPKNNFFVSLFIPNFALDIPYRRQTDRPMNQMYHRQKGQRRLGNH